MEGRASPARRMTSYDAIDFTVPSAIVMGAEGTGLRRLVRERCDFLAAIPMGGSCGQLECARSRPGSRCSRPCGSAAAQGARTPASELNR